MIQTVFLKGKFMSLEMVVIDAFTKTFGDAATLIVRAPGRVNLIGEHTDYNDGFVLPMAIDRAVWIALRPREDDKVIAHPLDFDGVIEFDLRDFTKEETSPAEYIKGVANALREDNIALNGWEGVFSGDVPIGAGLSSSAALEMATAQAFCALAGVEWDAPKMALAGQRAENQWVGVNTGIMDQMISAGGQQGSALLIDCRSLELKSVPLPPDTVVLVLDTNTRRGLVDSKYNERRESCEAAANHFGISHLRDITLAEFLPRQNELDDVTRRRALHVISENERTLAASEAMLAGDALKLGELMQASHVSMRDDFEISSDALNAIADSANAHDACFGARMTGGGFAGCGVALIRANAVDDVVAYVEAEYNKITGLDATIYVCHPAQGATVIQDAR